MSLLTQHGSRFASVTSRVPISRHVYALSIGLAIVGGVTAALTFAFPYVLTGPPVTNGNARGTALVVFGLATPLLVFSIWWHRRGSWRARFLWLGSLFYLGYNAFLFLFLTPFNSLFLLYVATLSLALFAIFALVLAGRGFPSTSQIRRIPVRGLAVFVWAIVALNALAWLQVVVPAVLSDDPTSFLDGLGVATNAIYVQDLAVWLPVMAVAAWWMWNRRPRGVLLTGSWLAFGILEGIGIAVDQWFGHEADPGSPHASLEVIPMMVGLAIVNLVGLYFYLRRQSNASGMPEG
ncbi:MAG TPA: hypothetical protein VJQ79_08690 [Acidimicrobiia bacterium]|nr:hypothetical protein [Acidimicrobiia bacterium]